MLNRGFFFVCLAGCLLGPGLMVYWLQSRPVVSASRQPIPAGVSDSTITFRPAISIPMEVPLRTPSEAAMYFASRMVEWEQAEHLQADKIEEELKALIDDQNVAAITQTMPSRFQKTYLGLMVQERWAKLDREAAVNWLSNQEKPTHFQIAAAVRDWTVKNDERMYRYIASLIPGDWKNGLLAGLGQDALNNGDPEQAYLLLCNLPPGDEQTRLLSAAVVQWSQWDPKGALEQIGKMSDIAVQEKIIPSVAIGYAINEPRAAADWLIQSLEPGMILDQGLAAVIQIWANQHDATEAAVWLAQIPEGKCRSCALQALLTIWRDNSPQSAKAWVESLPDGSLRAEAVNEFEKLAKP